MAQRQAGGRARAGMFLGISALAAIVAVAFLYKVIQGYQEELEVVSRPDETLKVVVANRTLYQGMTLAEEDLGTVEVVPAFVPEGTFRDPSELVGHVPRERILSGEYIRQERLAAPEAGLGLNAIIPNGQRAVSIPVTNGSAVSGFLEPGNYVDVLFTLESEDLETKITKTVLQARKVLAVNSRLGIDEDEDKGRDGQQHAPSVTLAVTPEEAEKLAHGRANGVLTLTLRNDVDVTEQITQGAHTDRLLGRDGEAPTKFENVKPKQPTKRLATTPAADDKIQLIKGSTERTETLPK